MKNNLDWKKTLETFVFTIYGGFVGAVFSLYATGTQTGIQVWFLIFFYGVIVLIILCLLNLKRNKNTFS